jgi:GTP:adenosylcobinamide-phosphate guanylyltransferase
MKAPEWDDGLFTAHRNYIEVEEVRRAFDYLSAAAFRTDLFSIQNSGVGRQKKSFHYNEPLTTQRPFAFIVNRGHLLFYVRLPGQARFPGGIDFFKQSFTAVNDNPDGEWTIRIETLEDAKRIQKIALCTISRNGPARFRVNGPTLHGLPAEPRFGSFTRPFSLRQVFWL